MDRRAWQATVQGPQSQTRLSMHTNTKRAPLQTVSICFGFNEQLREGTTASPYHIDSCIHILWQAVSRGSLDDLGNLMWVQVLQSDRL